MRKLSSKLPFDSLLDEAEAIERQMKVWRERVKALGEHSPKTRKRLNNLIVDAHKMALEIRVKQATSPSD